MLQSLLLVLSCLVSLISTQSSSAIVSTTSGTLHGIEQNEVMSFKGVRFAQSPTGDLPQNATGPPPSCLQQFAFATSEFTQFLFNNPPPASEDEDCLFLNVWAPSSITNETKAVLVWIFGGGFAFGSGSLPLYDGNSLAANQDIVVVTFNYRTNLFGFPSSEDLPITQNNLGILDQELALQWVQQNIAKFGGDPKKGYSAGGQSVGLAIVRDRVDTPFRAGIMLSGTPFSASPVPSFSSFDAFAAAVGCSQHPGALRLACLRKVPASTIGTYTNGPFSGAFRTVVDNVTIFTDPLEHIRAKATARVPILLGGLVNDGSFLAVNMTNVTSFLAAEFPGSNISSDFVRPLYPGLDDNLVISDVLRDFGGTCPDELWSAAMTGIGVSSVFRYSYGAVFADLQVFPGAGAWHSSELRPLFGNFNRSTATPAEVEWSSTFQTAIAKFVKDPETSPALNWPKYIPGPSANTLAKLAYNSNIAPDGFVDAVQSNSLDGPCDALWNQFLDVQLTARTVTH
ncbi:Alpha/Beta hydrolase protein [Mycena galericulata]|nr:Alpha/Beta hydrolase protein [Mycena galericulata]